MLSQDDRQRLQEIETALRTDDPRFADAMRAWRPCPPREYRRRLRPHGLLLCLLVTFALAVAVAAGAFLG
ncbi:MAG TPA: DUF3040 domain-containing protein [Micromonosporaceae bacterium]|jgi:hypothetical protein